MQVDVTTRIVIMFEIIMYQNYRLFYNIKPKYMSCHFK